MNDTLLNPQDLLSFSEKLLEDASKVKVRTILSRCYYSCFLAIKKGMGKLKSTQVLLHKHAWKKVNRNNKALGSLLDELFHYRIVADYSLQKQEVVELRSGVKRTVKINEAYAKKSIKIAKKFFKARGR